MLRKIVGFDHCPKNVSDTWFPYSVCGMARYGTDTSKGIIINDKGALTCSPTPVNASQLLAAMDFSTGIALTQVIMGFRLTIEVVGNAGTIGYLAGGQAGTSSQQLGTFVQVFPTQKVGSTSYIEVVLDLNASNIKTYADGVLVSTNSLDQGSVAAMAAGAVWFFPTLASANSSGVASFRDFVMMDNIAGDGYNALIGARVNKPVGVDQVVSGDWTTTSSTLDALGTLQAPAGATDYLASAQSKQALTMSLSNQAIGDARIDAVQVYSALRTDPVGPPAPAPATALVNGASTRAGNSPVLSSSFSYQTNLGVFLTDPSGKTWTTGALDATSLSITPS